MTSQHSIPADDDSGDLASFEEMKRQAAAAGIPQDGPLSQKTADFLRARAGVDAQDDEQPKA